ncbi:nuclear pore complex protein Nup205-like protein [Sarcoptes scabiei]|nr:nuclear pore complex protein Nup205-like protein [Sarcoptes scabiei]
MVAILRCAVPRELKAQILRCFAAFSSSASVSTLIWREIESILPRYNSNMLGHPKLWQNGIAIEIEEIEVKNEEYPITIGFLELMQVLFSHYESGSNVHQKMLSGNCFKFILDSILLKTTFRVFKNIGEKWTIIKLGYKLFLNIIEKCDFSEGLNNRTFNVFSQILQENLLFRHIISSLDESVAFLESYYVQPTLKDYDHSLEQIEECCKIILLFLKEVCDKQEIFFESIRGVSGLSITAFVKLETLFNNINPKTNRQDRLIILFKLISFSAPISIASLKLLRSLYKSNYEITYHCLMQIFNIQNSSFKSETLNNIFVECLENESAELRREALLFIDTYLGGSAGSTNAKYTFAHKLVGIESKLHSLKNISLFGQSYTCLHSILSFFEPSINFEELIEERKLGMHIIYKLCSSIHTNEIVLRVLRSSYDFNMQYLKFWDRISVEQTMKSQEIIGNLIDEMTYFMKILAIDIRITSEQKLKSYYSSFINFLLKKTKKSRIIGFLYEFIFEHEYPTMQNFDYFDVKELGNIIEDSLNADNTIDLPLLHQKLCNEISTVGNQIALSSSGILREEINKIIMHCAQVNQSVQILKQKNDYVEAWCELVQTIILSKCLETMDEEMQSRFMTEINLELMNRMNDSSTNDSFFLSISSTILIGSWTLNEIQSKSISNITSCIRSIMQVLENSSTIWSQHKRARINFYASLLYLLRLIPSTLFNELKFSPNLLEKLTRDILSGHEVAKMLSISILNRCDASNWLQELILNGSLKQLLTSLLHDEREIRANKYEFIRAFYVFESKIMLLIKIFSSNDVKFLLNGLLSNLDLVNSLESLQCFDMYPYLICENPVCFKMFSYVLRLIITITTTNNRQIIAEFGSFLSSHSILHDLIRIAPTIKDSENGKEILLLISRLIGRLILDANKNLQQNFIGLLPLFCGKETLSPIECEIVWIILNSCVQLVKFNAANPIFEPSLNSIDSRIYSKNNLESLVYIINTVVIRSDEIPEMIEIVECSLYLLWIHLNIYFSMPIQNMSVEMHQEIELLRDQAESTFNEAFFAKIQSSRKNLFIDALCRRIKRIVALKNVQNFLI